MNEYVGADALHPPAMSRFYRDDVGIVPYKKMHNLPYKSLFSFFFIKPIDSFAKIWYNSHATQLNIWISYRGSVFISVKTHSPL